MPTDAVIQLLSLVVLSMVAWIYTRSMNRITQKLDDHDKRIVLVEKADIQIAAELKSMSRSLEKIERNTQGGRWVGRGHPESD